MVCRVLEGAELRGQHRGPWLPTTETDLRWPEVRACKALNSHQVLPGPLFSCLPPISDTVSRKAGRLVCTHYTANSMSCRHSVSQPELPHHDSQPCALTTMMCSVMKRRMCLGSAENIPLYSFSTSFWVKWEIFACGGEAASVFG